MLGGTVPVLGGTVPVLGGTGWSTVAMARGPALRPMQCLRIELLSNLWLAYGQWSTGHKLPLLLLCCLLQLLSLLAKAWHYLASAMHAYLADMLIRFSAYDSSAIRFGPRRLRLYQVTGSLVQSILYLINALYQQASDCL